MVANGLDEIRTRLETLLQGRDDLDVVPGPAAVDDPRLGPLTREFFAAYRRVATRSRGLEVAADLIGDAACFPGCITLGHYEYWELVVRPGDDAVHVVDGSEAGLDATDAVYPSLYHYLARDLQL